MLQTLTTFVFRHGFDGGTWDRNDVAEPDMPDAPLLPRWTERQGAGGPVVTFQDSVTYDGWARMTAWIRFTTDGKPLQRDSVWFDRTGNLHTFTRAGPFWSYGNEIYDPTTNRLLSRTVAGATTTYAYDRAGNLVSATLGTTVTTYHYDALNRLRAVRQNAVLIARYAYDVLGRWIAKRVYSSITGGTVAYTRFVYRGGNVAFETDHVAAQEPACVEGCTEPPSYGVSVTPDNEIAPDRLPQTSGYSATFAVRNTGNVADTYTFSCQGTPNVSCTGLSRTAAKLAAGGSTTVTASYDVGASGPGGISLKAFGLGGEGAWDEGSYIFGVPGPPLIALRNHNGV